jgi:hypothetical protein
VKLKIDIPNNAADAKTYMGEQACEIRQQAWNVVS